MNDTEEHRRSRARARYTDVAQILRPWLVYAQLRDLLAPESRIGWHLVNHAREMLRLHAEYPSRWEGLLNYFFIVTGRRLNHGASLDPAEWNRPDMTVVVTQFLAPIAPPAIGTSRSAQTSQGAAVATSSRWAVSSIGLGTRPFPCEKWNDAKPCAADPCPLQHVCKSCNRLGHTKTSCRSAPAATAAPAAAK